MIHINKRKYLYLIPVAILLLLLTVLFLPNNKAQTSTNKLTATVLSNNNDKLTVQDENNLIYTFNVEKSNYKSGDKLVIEYTGVLTKNTEKQNNNLLNIRPVSQDEDYVGTRTINGIFSKFSTLATNKVKAMTLDEKIGQILLVRYDASSAKDAINSNKVGGFVFFEKDFKNKDKEQVKTMINDLQKIAKIPLLTAVDEEGGKVVRISSNDKLAPEKFLSPRELYLAGGFELIAEDTKNKSALLESLGLNVNLAPVVDVSTNINDYMYNRTLGEGPDLTSTYATTVINANKGSQVSYVLKHFPGYGNNEDTHQGEVVDTRTFSDIEQNDLPPFEAGISAGAEAILVSHNTVQSIDPDNPASLSASVHNLLRGRLDFTGVIITDDLAMGAVSGIQNATVKALLAGNDIIITTDYKESFNEIKEYVEDGTISESFIDGVVERIIAWKYSKGLMYEKQK